jgi:hypothetical protein
MPEIASQRGCHGDHESPPLAAHRRREDSAVIDPLALQEGLDYESRLELGHVTYLIGLQREDPPCRQHLLASSDLLLDKRAELLVRLQALLDSFAPARCLG